LQRFAANPFAARACAVGDLFASAAANGSAKSFSRRKSLQAKELENSRSAASFPRSKSRLLNNQRTARRRLPIEAADAIEKVANIGFRRAARERFDVQQWHKARIVCRDLGFV